MIRIVTFISRRGIAHSFLLRLAVLVALATPCAASASTGTLQLHASLAMPGGLVDLRAEGAPVGSEVCFSLTSETRPGKPGFQAPTSIGCANADTSGIARLPHRLAPEVLLEARLEFRATMAISSQVANVVTRVVRPPGNVLILIADDLGVDRLGMYSPDVPPETLAQTPNLDILASQGLRFDRGYSAPNCSPTRASIQTGRQPWRTGVGTALSPLGKAYLRADETTLPEMLDRRTKGAYDHVAVGKWHLGSDKLRGESALEQGLTERDGTVNYENNPTAVHGWSWFAGTLVRAENADGDGDYYNWRRYMGTRDAPLISSEVKAYTTVTHVDAAIEAFKRFDNAEPDKPWLMYVAFNAPHTPFTCPPSSLLSSAPCTKHSSAGERYNAMVEAIDTEIGRLIATLDGTYPRMAANTTVIFIGDNGTPNTPAADAGRKDFVKGTIYEGGIHVPFIVRSPLIPAASRGTGTDAMVHAVDFYATVAEIAGGPFSAWEIETQGLDSVSFVDTLLDPAVAVRDYVISELFETAGLRNVEPNRVKHHRAILSQDWKLHVEYAGGETPTWTERLYDLGGAEIEGAAICSGSAAATAGVARGPAAANCTAHSPQAATAYLQLRSIERSIRAEIDPLHGHCGDESMHCPIPLPVRVMPQTEEAFLSGTYSVARWFRLTQSEASRAVNGHLYIQGHRLGYRDGNTNAAGVLTKDGKASVKLGACDWTDLTNDGPAVLYKPERHYGGIGGGFRTVRLTVPLADMGGPCVDEGFNRIQFRFNGTDGVSSGYRILEFNLHDNTRVPILPPEAFVKDDPDDWTAPFTDLADITLGQQYFEQRRSLLESPIDQVMTNAACSDCHARDGRDLEYYAYSNESIINRAVFHGLTVEQGEQIASYIRSLDVPRHGRPWNPPYQPGTGVDTRQHAIERWAAWAGLDAVLDSEKPHAAEILDAIFPRGWADATAIADQLRGKGLPARTINLREIPIAIQLPDWNSWLPEKHPFDLWGKPYRDCTLSDCTGSTPPANFPTVTTPERSYLDMRAKLSAGFAAADIPTLVGPLEDDVRAWLADGRTLDMGSEWRTLRSPALDLAIRRGYANDFTKRSLAQWMAVKYWEVAQEFDLERHGPEVYPEDGEFLSWPFGNHQTVHAVAPHITSNNRNNLEFPLHAEIGYQAANGVSLYCKAWCFDGATSVDSCVKLMGETPTISDDDPACDAVPVRGCFNACDYPQTHAEQTGLKGDYDSTAWYHLQMVLHAGARNPDPEILGDNAVRPVDWPYALIHIDDLAREVDEASGADVWESLRYVATLAKAYQMRDNGVGPGRIDWSMRDISPRLLVGSYRGYVVQDELWDRLDDYLPGHPHLRVRLGAAFLHAFLDVISGDGDSDLIAAFDNWPLRHYDADRNDKGDSWWKLDPPEVRVSFVEPFTTCTGTSCPVPIHGVGTGNPDGDANGNTHKEFRTEPKFQHANHIYRAIPWLKNLGFDAGLLSKLACWAGEKWPGDKPKNDWTIPLAGLACP